MSYSQTYIVKTTSTAGSECQEDDSTTTSREAFFQVGNYCYAGDLKLSLEQAFGEITLSDIPSLVPIVQRQQSDLSHLCDASNIPQSSKFYTPIKEMEKAREFVISEITSNSMTSHLNKLREKYSWLNDDESQLYFELVGDTSSMFPDILFIANRVYDKGLRYDTIFFEGVIYCTLEDATAVTAPLLDVTFPNLGGNGSMGVTLAIYDTRLLATDTFPWMKLSVWKIAQADAGQDDQDSQIVQLPDQVEVPTTDLSSDCYVQTYCILKSEGETDVRDVMFRFGSWIYSGQVDLVDKMSLKDIPYVIPALRLQQSKLSFVSEISCLPTSSPFALSTEYAARNIPQLEAQAAGSEAHLKNCHWLEGADASESFFEFSCFNDVDSVAALGNVDLIATKSYHPSGVVSISLYFGGNFYLVLREGNDFPLLDSKFPDLACKGEGFTIQCYPGGISGWPQLRKLSIWRIEGDGDDSTEEEINETGSVLSEQAGEDQNEIASIANQSDDDTNTHQEPAQSLKNKLAAICDASSGETAWGADGRPMQKSGDANSNIADDNDVATKQSDECDADSDDIYAQLDNLERKLEKELTGLDGLLK